MTTYDLRTQDLTVDDLLRLAADTAIQVISRDGQAFVIEVAEDFEQEGILPKTFGLGRGEGRSTRTLDDALGE